MIIYWIITIALVCGIIIWTNPHIVGIICSTICNKHQQLLYNIVKATNPKPLLRLPTKSKKLDPSIIQKIKDSKTLSFLVVKDRQIILEQYYDSQPGSKILSFSAAKSIIGLMIGIALDKGMLHSLDQTVVTFFPELKISPKVKIRDLLTMSSGLKWNENFRNPFADVVKAYYTNDLWNVVKHTRSIFPPGKQFSYKCINSILLGLILEKASGMSLSNFTQKFLWTPIGAEFDALWAVDAHGVPKTFCCIYAAARDYAKVGLTLLNKGFFNGQQIVSSDYIGQMTTAATYLHDKQGNTVDYYGFHIWITKYNGMTVPYFRGMFGQYVFILPKKNAVIVRLGKKRVLPGFNQTPQDVEFYLSAGLQVIDN